MERAGGIVYAEAAAKRIQRSRGAGKFAPRDCQSIDGARHGQRLDSDPAKLGIDEFHVKGCIMDHERRILDEIEKIAGDCGENGLVSQKFIPQPMHLEGRLGHGALGVDILVIGFAGGHVIPQLERTDFHDAITAFRLKAGGFGIKHDLTHRPDSP